MIYLLFNIEQYKFEGETKTAQKLDVTPNLWPHFADKLLLSRKKLFVNSI